ncbi:MAG: hypothetical protein ACMXYL_01690 [Candidatus Woesearchaeota archaeon]
MRIKTDNTKMTLDDLGIVQIVFGLIFAVVGIALFFVIPFVYNQFASYVPLIFLAVGGLVIATWSRLTIVLDKNLGRMTLNRKGLLKKQDVAAELSDIKSVEYRKDQQMTFGSTSASGRGSTGPRMRITETITLISSKVGMITIFTRTSERGMISLGAFGTSKTLRQAQEIANFLQIPLVEKNPIAEAAGAIKTAVGIGGNNQGQI